MTLELYTLKSMHEELYKTALDPVVLPLGIGAYHGARKAQQAGEDASSGAVRGALGATGGALLGGLGGLGLGYGAGRVAGLRPFGSFAAALPLAAVGELIGGKKGYQAATKKYEKQGTQKEAAADAFERKLPWYTTAAGGLLGSAGGGALVPQKYKLLGQLGGALAGTAVGLEGGERIGRRLDRAKTAAQEYDEYAQPTVYFAPERMSPTGEPVSSQYGPFSTLNEFKSWAKKNKRTVSQHEAPSGEPGELGSWRAVLSKTAAESKKDKPSSPGKVLAKSLGGMAAGMGAGYLIPKGIDAALVVAGKQPIMPSTASGIGTFAGGALGLAAPLLHYATLQRMREEHLKNQEAKRVRQGS